MSRFLAIVFVLLLATPAGAADLSAASNEELIASFVHLDSQSPGASALGDFTTFMAEDRPSQMVVGVVGAPSPSVAPAMRELVRRGISALPNLLKHIDDPTATKVVVGGGDFFMWEEYGGEYDTRPGPHRKHLCEDDCPDPKVKDGVGFSGAYTVKVGDLCFLLIGQIVDRSFQAVRYQPTAGLIVNSPIEMPWMARRARRDWGGLTTAQHKASLIKDIRHSKNNFHAQMALTRLRFYYPKAYASLTGVDAKKRMEFEADEKNGSAAH